MTKTANITTVGGYVQHILQRADIGARAIVYRGHPDASFKLEPAIFRNADHEKCEHLLIRELVAAHPSEFAQDSTTLEQLVRMQHYALPTRLLDVTWNPLVALYFAVQPQRKKVAYLRAGRPATKYVEADGEVILLTVLKRKVKYYDSDKVSCIANISKLAPDQRANIDFSLDPIEIFNGQGPIRRLVHFVRQEKYAFEPEIISKDLKDVVLVKPKQSNKRILAQDGGFFVFGLTKIISDPNDLGIKIERISIPAGRKRVIRQGLSKLAINEKTLFPEIDRAASYLTKNTGQLLSKLLKVSP